MRCENKSQLRETKNRKHLWASYQGYGHRWSANVNGGDGSNAPPTKLIGTGPPTKPPSLFSTLKTLTFTEQLLNKLVFFFCFCGKW